MAAVKGRSITLSTGETAKSHILKYATLRTKTLNSDRCSLVNVLHTLRLSLSEIWIWIMTSSQERGLDGSLPARAHANPAHSFEIMALPTRVQANGMAVEDTACLRWLQLKQADTVSTEKAITVM